MTTELPTSEEQVNCCTRPPGLCKRCGSEKSYIDCWNCGGEGLVDHDCGEDTCCCMHPELNVGCDICLGEGHYFVCATCHPESFDD